MSPIQENALRLPDIASAARAERAAALDWVGMDDIQLPVLLPAGDAGPLRIPARVSAQVDLAEPSARGIHMSRLFLEVDRLLGNEVLSPCLLRRALKGFLDSHQGLSTRALIRVRCEYPLRRRALASPNSGWRGYPLSVAGVLQDGRFDLELGFEATYSSTCPASAALARQLIQRQFEADFPPGTGLDRDAVLAWLGSERGICATPHAQRSTAQLRVRLAPSFADFPVVELIDAVEAALATPVQTAVKREDEQAFARLNGANLMFCEDAARRLRASLDGDARIEDFWIRTVHHESLHAHDAVAVVTRGVPGGYRSDER